MVDDSHTLVGIGTGIPPVSRTKVSNSNTSSDLYVIWLSLDVLLWNVASYNYTLSQNRDRNAGFFLSWSGHACLGQIIQSPSSDGPLHHLVFIQRPLKWPWTLKLKCKAWHIMCIRSKSLDPSSRNRTPYSTTSNLTSGPAYTQSTRETRRAPLHKMLASFRVSGNPGSHENEFNLLIVG